MTKKTNTSAQRALVKNNNMSELEVLKYPDPFLRTVCEPLSEVDDDVRRLMDDMVETMYANKGIGLAAVQVGVAKRVIVLDVPDDEDEDDEETGRRAGKGKNLLTIANPEIAWSDGKTRFEEGCLSVPGINAEVERAARVRVTGLGRDGEPIDMGAEGLLAIALQHEIDHLDGVLFIDRLSWLKRDRIKRRLRKALEETAV